MSFKAAGFAAAFAFSLFLGLGTGLREFFIISAAFGAVLGFCLISALLSAALIKPSFHLKTDIVLRLEDGSMKVTLKGAAVLPSVVRIEISDAARDLKSGKLNDNSVFLNIGKINKSFDFKIKCPHCGKLICGVKKIYAEDIFGLFFIPFFFKGEEPEKIKEIKVLPISYSPEIGGGKLDPIEGNMQMSVKSGFSGETPDDIRDYHPGDPIKRINWKLSAKFKRLFIRIYEDKEDPKVFVLLDGAMLKKDPVISDIALETALTLAGNFGGKKKNFTFSACRLSSQDLDFTVENSEDLLKFPFLLTDLEGKEESSAYDIPYSAANGVFEKNADLYIISDNISKKSLKRISKMINNGVRVSFIIPFKKDIPEFLSEETGSGFCAAYISDCSQILEKVGGLIC